MVPQSSSCSAYEGLIMYPLCTENSQVYNVMGDLGALGMQDQAQTRKPLAFPFYNIKQKCNNV